MSTDSLSEIRYITREGITPRNLIDMRLDEHVIGTWVKQTNRYQFWSYQYMEHCYLIHLALTDIATFDTHKQKAVYYYHVWKNTYQTLISDKTLRPSIRLLLQFREYNLQLLKDVIMANSSHTWSGWAPPSMYEHMIREIEYVLREPSYEGTLAFWLTDMEGHAAMDGSWTDPCHTDLVMKAQEFTRSYHELKLKVGQGEGRDYFALLNRRDEKVRELQNIIEESNDIEQLRRPHVLGDLRELLSRLYVLQVAFTEFNKEYKRLMVAGKIFNTMPPLFVEHTIRESMRASYELGELIEGRLVC